MRPRWAQRMLDVDTTKAKVFQFMRPAMGATVGKSCFACKKRFQFMRPAMGATRNSKQQQPSPIFQFMRPAMGATARFRYYLAIYTRFSIYLSFLYTIIFNHHFHFLFFGASLPVFLCMLITRTLHLIQLS